MSYTFLERLQHYNESLTKVILLEISFYLVKLPSYVATDTILFLYTAFAKLNFMYTAIDKIGSHRQNQYLLCLELI